MEQIGTEGGKRRRRVNGEEGPRGRRDSAGQEEVLKAKPVKDKISYLVELYNAKEEAKTTFNDAKKAVAEEAGVNVDNLNSLIVARAMGTVEEKRRSIGQLVFLFDKVGE